MAENGFNIGDYERLLESHYDDVPDEWDLYENMGRIHTMAESGMSTEEIFQAEHGTFFSRQVRVHEYDGSEFGD